MTTHLTEREAVPTMPQAACACPDDCDCDGRFACEVRAGNTTHTCELVVGHAGQHRSGNHRWDSRCNRIMRGYYGDDVHCTRAPAHEGDCYSSTITKEPIRDGVN